MVMVLLSAVNLVQSGEENLMAITQEGSSDALAMAELGVSRYRDFLINNRVLAINNLDNWTNANILSQICNTGISGAGGWADNSNGGWRDVNVNGNNIGSYRLVQYEYDRDGDSGDNNRDGNLDDTTPENNIFSQIADDGDLNNDNNIDQPYNNTINILPFEPAIDNHNDLDDNGTTDAVGLLTVQGQDLIGSIAQIQVQIPLSVNQQELDRLGPALWIQQTNINNIGNVDIDSNDNGIPSEPDDGNIILKATPGVDGCNDPPDLADENTFSDPRDLPPLIEASDITGLNVRHIRGNIDHTGNQYTGTNIDNPANYYNTSNNKIVLGTRFDNTNGGPNDPTGSPQALNVVTGINGNQEFYYYTTRGSNLRLDDGQAIIADGTSKVILHVGGNLVINTGTNGVRLVNAQHTSETGNSTPPGIARYLEIHVEGDLIINGIGNVDLTGLLRVGGTIKIRENSTVNVIGSIWTDDWNFNRGTINIDTDQTTATIGNPPQNITVSEYNFYSITPYKTPAPITSRPSGWERQEATN